MPTELFDYRNVKTLAAPATGRTTYVDAGLSGREHGGSLVLRVSASGVRMYYVVYRHGAHVRKVKLGPVEHEGAGLPLADARKLARAVLGRVAKGEDPAAEKRAKRLAKRAGAHSFEKLGQRLIKRADIAESTRRLWTWTLTRYLAPKLSDRPPGAITRGDVRDLLAGIKSKAVAKNARRLVAWIFARAVEEEIVGASPCVGLGRPPKEAPRDRVLTHAELRSLWKAAGESGAYGAAIRWLMLTAARKEEAFAATWAEIDRDAKTWAIPAARAKNRARHVVPLSPAALEILDGLTERGADARIFGPTATSKAWRQLLQRAGIVPQPEDEDEDEDGDEDLPLVRRPWTAQPIRIHDIRRTVRNALTHELGVNVAVAEAVIGHKAPKLVETYNPKGIALRDLRGALDRWAAYLKAIASGERAPKVRQMPAR